MALYDRMADLGAILERDLLQYGWLTFGFRTVYLLQWWVYQLWRARKAHLVGEGEKIARKIGGRAKNLRRIAHDRDYQFEGGMRGTRRHVACSCRCWLDGWGWARLSYPWLLHQPYTSVDAKGRQLLQHGGNADLPEARQLLLRRYRKPWSTHVLWWHSTKVHFARGYAKPTATRMSIER